jgi:exopolysaccharide biosynthesis operon protein EpsL
MKIGAVVNACVSGSGFLLNIAGVGLGLLALLIGAPVCADQFDTLNFTASVGMNYDGNIFRIPSWMDAQLVIGKPNKSDFIMSNSLGIVIDKKYANQEVVFNANVTDNKFNTFSNLDYFNTAYYAAWNWSVDSILTGTLSDNRTQTLNSFTDVHIYTRNLTTVDSRNLDASLIMHRNCQLLFGASNRSTTSSVSVVNNQSTLIKSGHVGLKFISTEGSSISLIARNIKGDYINVSPNYYALVDSGYDEQQKEIQINWPLSGKSSLNGNLMHINHRYPRFYQRDYSGMQCGINYFWSIRDKTSLNISLNRSMSSWFDFASSYNVTDAVSITPSWQISTKNNMHIAVRRSRSDYLGPIVPYLTARHDTNQSEEIGLDWSPQRSVKLAGSLQHSHRTSNSSSYEFSDNSANIVIQVSF